MENRWAASVRFIANQIPRAAARTTLTYRFHPRFAAGLEWNPKVNKFSPLANWLALEEREKRPALIFGTSSDRIGTPTGQSVYGTVSKGLERETGLPIAPYVGLSYGTFDDRLRVIGGMNIEFPKNWSAMLIFDGVHLHETVSWSFQRHTFSFLLIDSHDPGVSYSLVF